MHRAVHRPATTMAPPDRRTAVRRRPRREGSRRGRDPRDGASAASRAASGPMVMHSPWWIEGHWGRAFEIISLSPDGFGGDPSFGHGSVLMRKRNYAVDTEMLKQTKPEDTHEAIALTHNVAQMRAEILDLRGGHGYLGSRLSESVGQSRFSRHRLWTSADGWRLLRTAAGDSQGPCGRSHSRFVLAEANIKRRLLDEGLMSAAARSRANAIERHPVKQ